ncbi:MAG TPA: acyl-CoA desaturase [Solirubrobacterales bacterium]|nr:acyl-CoA desaturase [Solirubrobacterales bacterium]
MNATATTEAIEPSPLARLSDEQLTQIAAEFDAIRDRVMGELGDRDRRYIENVIALHRRLAVLGRVLLLASRRRPAWLAGTAALAAAKVLENMEIGHNVMHGQWDWMNDPRIHSTTWDWDNVSPAEAWKHSHNYEHHTFTNIRGKDRDLGYEIMRVDPEQPWHPVYLLQPLYNLVLAALFEWGVALHDLNFEAIRSGEKPAWKVRQELRAIGVKVREQARKDYLAWPLLSGLAMAALGAVGQLREERREPTRRGRRRSPLGAVARRALGDGVAGFRATLAADLTANLVRNVWAYAIIFCGHFPEETYSFSEAEVEDESPGGWYVRQLLGSANIEGGPLFHLAAGNLGYQVEHHLFPDMPSSRYAEVAPRVRETCHRHGLPYNSGPLGRQLGTVQRAILRLAFPGGRRRRTS